MGALSSWLRGRKALASAVALAVLAGVPVSVALLHPGFPVTDVKLNTRDVWVTNGKSLLGGRINHQIGELDAKVNGSSSHLDVLQDGGATLLTDTSQGSVQVIDPAFVSLTEKITVPPDATLSYGGNTLAILSPQGKLWVLDTSQHLKFDQSATPADAKLGPDAQVVVSKSGKVFGVSPGSKKLYTIDDPSAQAKTASFPALKRYQLSAVGEHPVVLDTAANTLVTENGSAQKLPAKGLRIQQAGPDSDTALVATGTGLLRVPLGGGDIAAVPAQIESGITSDQDVSAPVFLNGCDYGAWSGAQKYLYACEGGKAVAQDIDRPVQGSDLVFRVNHGVIALNNLEDGNAWLVSSNMRLVNNWAQVNPDVVTKDGQTGKERPVKASFEDAVAHRTTVNKPPVAVADNFGVRPRRTTVLPVLSNDTDPDGDVLTITTLDPIEAKQGKLDVIDGGRAVQFTPAQTASSTVSFRYTITDGRKAFATAQVNVTLRPTAVNAAPTLTRSSTTAVEVGQSIKYNVLNDWIDPDGDDIYLVGASATTSDAVQFAPDGFVTFTSKTGQTGSKEVAFTVSDGRTISSGKLTVTVKPADSLDPVAVPDFATAFTGSSVVIHPLENDISPAGSMLSLLGAKADNGTDATATADQDRSTISFEANATGAYYLTYTLAAGSHTTQGLVLVNVSDPPTSKRPPIAVKDTAYVRPGEPSTVNVLDNDVSPSGRVLVVQSVEKGTDAASLNVEVLANSVIRVTAPGVLARQVQLSYTISDGYATSTAGITVVPIPPLVNHQPPVAEPDAATVRAGDVATVHVLDNDSSPDNEPFTLDSVLKSTSKMGVGAEAFVSKKVVRYQAPNKPGVYTVSYGITDRFTQTATAMVTFTVLAASKKNDRAPQPQELTARAFAGAAVDVVIPLDGLDPDGDSVSLDGVQTAPALGRITKTTATSLTYQAYPTSMGTDTFSYGLIDTYGKTAVGTVHIGIVPRPSTVKPPTAVDDKVEIKPGKTASVPVLLNDSDPNGYVISLLPKLPEVQAPLKARVSGGNVLVTAPPKEGAYVIRYQISNGQGGSATAFIQVVVTKNATPVYPTAADHVVGISDLTGKSSIGVDVLDGALNPSGLVGDLRVAVEGPHAGAAKVGDDGKVTVTPGEHRMAITYSLTDPASKLAGKAFIIVAPKPGSADASTAPPRIKPGLAQQVIAMNGEKTWKLSQIIDVPSGRSFSMTGASGTTSTHGTGKSPYTNAQTLTFAAAKNYRGPAAITFRVNDGKDPGTTKDRITLLTLPITVGSPDQSDVPPTFTPPNLTIEAGEKPQTIDLRTSSFHPNPQVLSQLSYRGLTGATKDVVASLSGSQLTVSSPLGVQPGTTARLRLTVSYKNFTIPGSVNVRVVSSTRPVASQKNAPQQRELKRGTAGGTTLNNAVSNTYWINPFPDKALVILDATAVSAPKGVTVSHTASSITVEAGTAAAAGRVNIQYHVQDGTKDPQRVQIGQLTVTIHDVPDQPPAPSNVTASDAQAAMQISAPKSDNGKAIDSYQVSWNGGSATTGTGTFTATKLTNGTRYSFKVRAHNADGWGAWSSLSASVTPYGTPSAPRNVTLKGSDQYATSLTMSWSAPSVTGGGAVQYSYKFDGGNWSSWSTARTATRKAAVGKHSFTVRAKNVGSGSVGASTASNIWQINKKPAPKRSVTIAKSGSYVSGTCQSGCSFYNVTIKNFAKGSYTIHYYCPGPTASSYSDTIKASSNGSGSFNSKNGSHFYCGFNTYVKVDGVKSNTENFKP